MPQRTPSRWECGPDADEWAGDQGEALQAARHGENDYDYSGRSRSADGPYHAAEYFRLEGYREQW